MSSNRSTPPELTDPAAAAGDRGGASAPEQALRESEARYRMLVEQSLVGIYIVQDWRFVYVNPRFAEAFGYTPSEIVGLSDALELIHEADRERVRDSMQQRLAGASDRASYTFRGLRRDGTTIVAEVQGQRTEVDGRPALIGVMLDVTDRARAEEALRDSVAAYEGLFNSLTEAVYIQDREGRFLNVNSAVERMYGYPPEALVGQTPAILGDPDRVDMEATIERLRRAFDGEPQRFEWWGRRRNGEVFPKEVALARATYHGEEVVIAVARDVSERKALEARLLQAQKLEAVGQLAGGIAHDFNNVLTAIQGRADLLLDDLSDPERTRADLLEIRKSAERAAGLVRQLLAFGRRQLFQPRTLDLNRLLEDADGLLRTLVREDVELELVLEPGLEPIHADPVQLRQVVTSLVVNAREAMREGGVLRIRSSNAELDAGAAARLGGLRPGPYVVLRVSDTGPGMTPEVRERVFEPFFTTKPQGEGAGMGLSSAWGIMRQSGGHIAVESRPGAGTTFTLYFPATRTEPPGAAAPEACERCVSKRTSVLLVEDEDAVRMVARRILDRAGYSVVDVGDPREALRLCCDGEIQPDAIVTDVVMPELSGPALVARLAESGVVPKVLFVSGYSADAAPQLQDLPPHAAYLPKPFTVASLTEALRGLLEAETR